MASMPSLFAGEERGMLVTSTPKPSNGKERCHHHLEGRTQTKRQSKRHRQRGKKCPGLTRPDDDADEVMGELTDQNADRYESSDDEAEDDLTAARSNPGLHPPSLHNRERINGNNKKQLRKQNKQIRIACQENQEAPSYWAWHTGDLSFAQAKNNHDWPRGHG